jgi:outer membrane protein assembly factor BamB
MMTRSGFTSLLTLAIVSLTAGAADWPQWRGPQRDGVSEETGLLQKWSEGGPKLLWRIQGLGGGYSTPSVVEDRLYLLNNEGMEKEFVRALRTQDGGEIWSTQIGKVGPNTGPQYPGARTTPTVDGDVLYALGSDGDLACLAVADGNVRWQKNLRREFGGKPGKWAYAESPLIDGDVLVCTPGGNQATIVALNKSSGEVIWKSAVPGGDEAAYASVIVVETGGLKQYVQFLQNGVVGVDAGSGKFLWRYERTAQGSPANIPTPVAFENLVYSAAGRSGGGLVRLAVSQKEVDAEQVYFTQELPTAIGGSVRIGDLMYGTNGGGLVCAEFATGDVKWQDRSIGAASVVFADGLLFLHGENGEVALVEATPEEYREKGRFTPPERPAAAERSRSKAWAYPALADGRLYIHDWGTLWCYDVKQR